MLRWSLGVATDMVAPTNNTHMEDRPNNRYSFVQLALVGGNSEIN